MSSRPKWKVVTVETRGGRPVYLLEHSQDKERVRVYLRSGRLRYYDAAKGDARVSDRAIVAAVRRAHVIHRGEAEARRTLFPTTSRRVKATHKEAPVAVERPGA